MDGSSWIRSQWAVSQPDGKTNENCLIIDSETGNWIDIPCSRSYPFICKISTSDSMCADFKKKYVGKTVAERTTSTWEACGKYCIKDSLCKFWTWRFSNNLCILKEDGQIEDAPGSMAGTKWCPRARCWGHRGNGNCCTDDAPCYAGQGGCKTDSNCVGSLKCGADCKEYTSNGADWLKCCGP